MNRVMKITDRVSKFIENCSIDLPSGMNSDIAENLIEIWNGTLSKYLQSLDMEYMKDSLLKTPMTNYGFKMFCADNPIIHLPPPISYMSIDELSDVNPPEYRFLVEDVRFYSLDQITTYLSGHLILNKEIFIYNATYYKIMSQSTYEYETVYNIRLKVIDWQEIRGRTQISNEKNKKNFTPIKNIPRFSI